MSTTWMRTDPPLAVDPREGKLPVWAQDLLKEARRRVEVAERVALDARLATKPEESDAVLDQYGDVPVGLGKDPDVTFRMEGGETVTVRRLRTDPRLLEVTASRALVFRPWVTNSVRVGVERD